MRAAGKFHTYIIIPVLKARANMDVAFYDNAACIRMVCTGMKTSYQRKFAISKCMFSYVSHYTCGRLRYFNTRLSLHGSASGF